MKKFIIPVVILFTVLLITIIGAIYIRYDSVNYKSKIADYIAKGVQQGGNSIEYNGNTYLLNSAGYDRLYSVLIGGSSDIDRSYSKPDRELFDTLNIKFGNYVQLNLSQLSQSTDEVLFCFIRNGDKKYYTLIKYNTFNRILEIIKTGSPFIAY